MLNLLRATFGLVLAMALFGSAASADQKVTYTLDNEVDAYLAAAEKTAEKAADNTLKAFWKDGLRLETADKKFKLKMGGRIMFDFGFQSADDDYRTVSGGGETAADDYAFFRRARLYVEGTIHGNVIYKAQYDFSKSLVTGLQDMFIGLQKTSLGRFRIGHMKAPAGLERLSSSKYLTFIERSTASNSFTFSRAVGINFDDHSTNERVWWGYGIFRPSLSDVAAIQDNKGYMGVVRIAGLPIKGKTVDGAPHILQIGVSFQYRDNRSNEVTLFRARTTNNLGERAIDTGTIASGSATIVGFEIAWVRGPVSVQSELFLANVDGNMGNPDPSFTGWYVQVSYWITGESRRWKTSVFSRVTPNANAFDGSGGKGAWEIALRFDTTDLNDVDNGVNGNEWTGYTLGLNWHWNPNTRAMFNYVNGNLDDTLTEGTIHAIMFRLQVDF